MGRYRDNTRKILSDDVLNNDGALLDWLSAILRQAARKGTTIPNSYVGVYDPDEGAVYFAPKSAAQSFFRHGHFAGRGSEALKVTVDRRYIPSSLTPPRGTPSSFSNVDPHTIPATNRSRRLVDRLMEHLDGGGRLEHVEDLRSLKSGLGENLRPADWKEVLAAAAALEQQFPDQVDFDAIYQAAGKDTHEAIRKEGGVRNFLGRTLREPTDTQKEWAAARGLNYSNFDRGTFWERFRALQKREKTETRNAEKRLRRTDRAVRETQLGDLTDLLEHGFGEKSLQKMREKGITLERLKRGQVSEDEIRSLGGISDGKIDKLRDLGLPLIPSASLKRARGRPPRALFGKGSDPFGADQPPALVGSRRVLVRTSSGNLETREVKSRLARWRADFAESFRDTIARPFAYFQQYRNDPGRQAIREADKLVRAKAAAGYLHRVQGTRTGLGAQLVRIGFRAQNTVALAVLLAVTLGILFLPVGILQFAGWLIFGLGVFILNVGYTLGLAIINLGFSGALAAGNALGFLINNSIQSFVDYSTEVTGGAPGTLPTYRPVEFTFDLAQRLDPNLWFPDCVNTNSLGAVLLHFAADLLHNAGSWLSSNGAFAVGASIIVLIGIPAYFFSRGASFGAVLLGLAIILVPTLSDFHIPAWGALALVLLGLALAVGARFLAADPHPIVVLMTVGFGVSLVVGGFLVYDTFLQGASLPDISRDIHVSAQPLAAMLGDAVAALGSTADYAANALTTGWTHALDKSKLEGLREVFTLGNPVPNAPGTEANCGG